MYALPMTANWLSQSGWQSTFAPQSISRKWLLPLGQQRSQRRAFDARNAPQTEHAARQHRTRGTGGNEAVRLLVPHLQHAHDRGRFRLATNAHDGTFVIGNNLRRIQHRQAAAHIVAVRKQGRQGRGITRQGDLQLRVLPQGLDCARNGSLGRVGRRPWRPEKYA